MLTLAIGIGANLAVFRLLHAVLFAQLPVAQPSQLYSLRAVKSPFDAQWFYSYPAYERLRQATGGIRDCAVGARRRSSSSAGMAFLKKRASSSSLTTSLVSSDFPHPPVGYLQASDDTPGQSEVPVVLRYGFAKEHFDSGQSVVGMKAVLNRVPIVVVGVGA